MPDPPPASGLKGTSSRSTFMVAIGKAQLEVDLAGIEEKMGPAFLDGTRSGANNCYIESLTETPAQQGEIAFVLKPPPGEGKYLVTLEATGSISPALVTCVRSVFGGFYHYANHPAFERVAGKLVFAPELIPAPPLPAPAALRAVLDERYARPVKVVRVTLKGVAHDVEDDELFYHYYYDVDLEFIEDGYEATCQHYETYKVFGTSPHKTPFAGHSCENQARKAGERTLDRQAINFRLTTYPSIAKSWELLGAGVTGTMPL
jgi:hypothetical protein